MRRAALLAALGATALAAPAPAASAATRWRSCADAAGFQCAVLRVPLDRTGRLHGTIPLAVARETQRPRGGRVLVALSGGPGQSTIGAAPFVADSLAPALGRYRLAVLDQRGTGASGVLRCPELQRVRSDFASAAATARCARQIGARRDAYATTDSVDDIEALRRALGVAKIALQGTSYGTYVAQQYARRYPTHVDRLILDSVVGADGVDPLLLDSYAAIPRVLGELCGHGACRGITSDPEADVRALLARLERGEIGGRVIDARGRAHRARIGAVGLTNILFAGDLNPHVQAALPAAVRAAVRGDAAPLLRLVRPSLGPPLGLADLSIGLNVATTCDDVRLDYPIDSPLAERPQRIRDAVAAAPEARLGPYSRALTETLSVDEQCRLWPVSHPRPPVSAPLPDVPALILDGRTDLRTPLENGRAVAAELPRAQVVTVPGTGHDELDSDQSGCVARALARWLGGRSTASSCTATSNAVPPDALAPTSLARTPAAHGVAGARGRVLAAALGALADVRASFNRVTDAGLADSAGGGLRGGRWRLVGDNGFALRRVAWVPGVLVSGRIDSYLGRYSGTLRVRAPHGLGGVLRFAKRTGIRGVLGGRRVRLAARYVRGAVPQSVRHRLG